MAFAARRARPIGGSGWTLPLANSGMEDGLNSGLPGSTVLDRRPGPDTSHYSAPGVRGTALRCISTARVRAWVAELISGGLSPARVRQALQVLHASLDVAVDDGPIARNPTAKVKAPRVEKRRQLFLTAFRLGRLADESREYAPLVWFLGWSGLRWGEAVALRVGRVNPKRRRVRVEESATEISGRLVFGPTKTHETRTVIVPRFVITRADTVAGGQGLRRSGVHHSWWRAAPPVQFHPAGMEAGRRRLRSTRGSRGP